MSKPKIVNSFSGGRTSAVMTKLLNDQYGDTHDIVNIFANTGSEHENTLKFVDQCDKHFGWNLIWVEAVVNPEKGKGIRHKVVDFDSAARDGEPLEADFAKHGLPGPGWLHCTRDTKELPIKDYVKDVMGWKWGDYWISIGIRADEMDRISQNREKLRFMYPLADAGWTKEDVKSECASWPFDLDLKGEHYGNCFSGDTKFITPSGSKTLSSMRGQMVSVLTREGWEYAEINSFGVQDLLEVTLQNGSNTKTIKATPDHKWFTPKYKSSYQHVCERTTSELEVGSKLISCFSKEFDPDVVGIVHGFTFGDGSLEGKYCRVYIDDCKSEIRQFFHGRGYTEQSNNRLGRVEPHFKDLPSLLSGQDYKAGFLAGLIASDGSVGQEVSISNKSEEVIDGIIEIAKSIGMIAKKAKPLRRDTNYKKDAELFQCTIPNACVPDNMILRSFHLSSRPTRRTNPKMWEVVSIASVDAEEVFCATVISGLSEFTLDGGILTHNCTWCWKKSLRKHLTLAKESPEVFDFPRRMEEKYSRILSANAEVENRHMFRNNMTTVDILEMARTKDFEPYRDIDQSQMFSTASYDVFLDTGSACGESCEIGADE